MGRFLAGTGNLSNTTHLVLFYFKQNYLSTSYFVIINDMSIKKKTTISLVGDVMLGRKVAKEIKKHGYKYPFEKVYKILKKSDITFANLESPISNVGSPAKNKRITFTAPKEAVRSLKYSGIDIVSLANNHVLDYQKEGMESTLKQLKKFRIKSVGLSFKNLEWKDLDIERFEIVSRRGIKFGFLAYSSIIPKGFLSNDIRPGVMPTLFFKNLVKHDIKELKKKADVVIVSIHMGSEYKKNPGKKQIGYALSAIDAGASLVVGHHPHVTQKIEKYKKGLIFYSLGNFIFDQNPNWRAGVDKGMIAGVTFCGKEIESYQITSVKIKKCQPRLVGAEIEHNI